jgi:hypothetical protein
MFVAGISFSAIGQLIEFFKLHTQETVKNNPYSVLQMRRIYWSFSANYFLKVICISNKSQLIISSVIQG